MPPVELGGGEREDLLLVLRVDAVGEVVDPPLGVAFPQGTAASCTTTEGTVAGGEFSVWAEYMQPWSDVLEIATYAERSGWHGVWYADHYMPNTGDRRSTDAVR